MTSSVNTNPLPRLLLLTCLCLFLSSSAAQQQQQLPATEIDALCSLYSTAEPGQWIEQGFNPCHDNVFLCNETFGVFCDTIDDQEQLNGYHVVRLDLSSNQLGIITDLKGKYH